MRGTHGMLLWAFVTVALVGCKGSTGEDASSTNAETPAAASEPLITAAPLAQGSSVSGQIAPNDTSHPATAVAVFLDALRRGDDQRILEMYTVRAREEAAQLNEHFAPRGSDTARFEVRDVQHLADDRARVACSWTDLDQNGEPHTIEFLWLVRRESQGWRVAGMEATPFPGEAPLFLDFENLEETIRRVNLLAEEIQRRAEMETGEAQQARISEDSTRR